MFEHTLHSHFADGKSEAIVWEQVVQPKRKECMMAAGWLLTLHVLCEAAYSSLLCLALRWGLRMTVHTLVRFSLLLFS